MQSADTARLIVKVGSSLLVGGDGQVRRAWVEALVAEVAGRIAAGDQIAIVSSGAIALGARRLGLAKGGRASLEDAQAAAAVGQIALAGMWADALADHSLTAAQMLVTLDDLEDRRRYLNASATLDRLLMLGVVPVINENDSVATEEIRFGDNDRLAARVGHAAGAARVVLLSDVDGLYTGDPSRDLAATRIARVERIDATIEAMGAGTTTSGMGTGGMAAKIAAARMATRVGIDLAIVSGHIARPLDRADKGEGTLFVGDRKASARKAWLSGRMATRGEVIIDAGAAVALANGASLLPAGVCAVRGSFRRGDVVNVIDAAGRTIARGLSEYDAAEAAAIGGMKRDEAAARLGHAPRAALIHRDRMVLM